MTAESVEVVLARLDGRMANLEAGQRRMEENVQRLAYVDLKLYQSEQTAQDEKIAASMTLAMWALGLVCGSVIVAVVALVVKLATA